MNPIVKTCALFLLIVVTIDYAKSNPIGTGGPTVVTEVKDALLTCVIMGSFSNDTVLWRRGNEDILAAGTNRVTSDRRFRVLHDETPKGKTPTGGDVWVLLITDTKATDTDTYTCEVNSDPTIKSFHSLKVKAVNAVNATSKSTPKTGSVSTSPIPEIDDKVEPEEYVHDFTECCRALNVSTKCLGFCTIHNIIDGTAGVEPDVCEADFPRIVKCMADGRNHVPFLLYSVEYSVEYYSHSH